MKYLGAFLFSVALLLLSIPYTNAQTNTGGTITYEQIIDYGLEGAYKESIWADYIANLPKSGKSIHVLCFSINQAFYEEDLSQKEAMSEELKTAIMKANYYKAPKPKIQQTFYDFKNQKQLEQMDFMTRSFLVESEIKEMNWKLSNKRKKVLDYVCMGADLEMGEETITAWFTPEIPISAGPAPFYGLPGMILGLEKNEEVFLLATSVDLQKNELGLISKLKKGQKIDKDKFEVLVKEKTEEYKKVKAAEMKGKSKSKN